MEHIKNCGRVMKTILRLIAQDDNTHMKCSLIVTTKNEEKSIIGLLDSIIGQSRLPDEVVITDAGSTDGTRKLVSSYQSKYKIKLVKLSADANRSMGRNKAIAMATHNVILITDAGCV